MFQKTTVGTVHRHKTSAGLWADKTDVASGSTHSHTVDLSGYARLSDLNALALRVGALEAHAQSPSSNGTPIGHALYLSPNGSDTADGSVLAPRKTLLAACQILVPGDTLLVRGGTYHDPGGFNWTRSGTQQASITVKLYPGELSVFDGGLTVAQALILENVSYLTFEGLAFTRNVPAENGVIIVSGNYITLRRIHSYGQVSSGPADGSMDHHVYIADGAAHVLVDDCVLDGLPGYGVLVHGGQPCSDVTVRDSTLINNGSASTYQGGGINAGSGLVGGSFTGNRIISNPNALATGIHLVQATGIAISGNRIKAPVGIWTEDFATAGPATETNDCIDAPVPFKVNWPGTAMTLAQWQATGRGAGTTVGVCP